ncbi:MAG: chorismate synthase [Clostridium sp.]|nr:chorismate synthase [Bacteroides sp.]MCM1197819.1 chorismate synthase [Clostridium sp.]
MNSLGRYFRVSVFGESHGVAIGAVLDGVPAGIPLSEDDFSVDIDRRRSGARGTTPRREADMPEILSGVYCGYTTGAPLAIIFRNGNTHSSDYDLFRDIPRPGHADYVASVKWNGYNDPRGGGHFSGRLTLPIVAAGVVAKKVLSYKCRLEAACHGMCEPVFALNAFLVEVGGISCRRLCADSGDNVQDDRGGLSLPQEVMDAIGQAIKDGDSLGGIVECHVEGLPVGLGEPFFDSVESLVSHAVFAIPGVRGIEFGDGFAAAGMKGSGHNDPIGLDGRPEKNGAGGINGGIANGAPLVFRVALKPTSSIRKPQHTANLSNGEMTELSAPGRHDACFALRAPVVVEAMAAIVLADLML